MIKPKTFYDLCSALQTGVETEINGNIGTVLSIERHTGGYYVKMAIKQEDDWIDKNIVTFFAEYID